MLELCLVNRSILYFRDVLESIHKFIIELNFLQCLFVRGSSEKQRRVGLFQISQKERIFHLLWQPSALVGNLTMWQPFFHPSRKVFLSPSVWLRRKNTWLLSWKLSLLIFLKKIARMFPIPASRNKMMDTF